MTIDELFRTLPRVIVAGVLVLFGLARIVRARRLSGRVGTEWEAIAGAFLLSLSLPIATTAYLVNAGYSVHTKQQVAAVAWWIAAVVSIVTFYYWGRRRES